jgi:hypothetical protein
MALIKKCLKYLFYLTILLGGVFFIYLYSMATMLGKTFVE